MIAIGTLTQNTELHEKWLQQQAADHRADGHAEAGEAGPDGDRPAPLARVAEHVGEDRQGGRHDQRPADAHQRRGWRSAASAMPDSADEHRADGEDDDADAQRPLAAEAVAEAAGGQQQAGEHERVAVDDPLELAVRGAEVVDQAAGWPR